MYYRDTERAEFCEFHDAFDDALRDRLVCGFTNENAAIKKRLLSEAKSTFGRALEIAIGMERAVKDSLELTQGRERINLPRTHILGGDLH